MASSSMCLRPKPATIPGISISTMAIIVDEGNPHHVPWNYNSLSTHGAASFLQSTVLQLGSTGP